MDSFNLKQFLVENKLTENSKLNEVKIIPGNTGMKNIKQLATNLVNQAQPGWDLGDFDYDTYNTPISDVNPIFVEYLKSLPSDNNSTSSGVANFDIVYKGEKYNVMFYIIYADANYDIYDEDMVVFELS
jgi:hypothetical protein